MRANPGGRATADEVIGRDGFIDDLWRILENQSVILTAERGIGKTTILHKMHHDALRNRPACFSVLHDLKELRGMPQFVEALYAGVRGRLGGGEAAFSRFWGLMATMGGVQVRDLQLPHVGRYWKKLLLALLEDLRECHPGSCVFFWDELPPFVYHRKVAQGEAAAVEVLEVLRTIRQRHPSMRMAVTGSVGLHAVIGGLGKNGYASDPMVDMRVVEVPALESPRGTQLAQILIEGEGLADGPQTARSAEIVSEQAGQVPFYIHAIVGRLSSDRAGISEAAIHGCVSALLTDPTDPAHFRHYPERIRAYYLPAEAALAHAALDALCDSPFPVPLREVWNRVRQRVADADSEAVRNVLQILARDHYVRRTEQGLWAFRYEIVRQWWKIERG